MSGLSPFESVGLPLWEIVHVVLRFEATTVGELPHRDLT